MSKGFSAHPIAAAFGLLAICLICYAVGLMYITPPDTLKGGIRELQFFSGATTWVMFSVLVITAARPKGLERWFVLDKYYLFHKFVAFMCVLLAFLHYHAKQVGRAILPDLFTFASAPAKAAATAAGATPASGASSFSWRLLAEESGLVLTYTALALVILTVLFFIPYKHWQKTHRLFPLLYLLMIFHAVYLTENYQYTSPLFILVVLTTIIAIPCALMSLCGRAGSAKRFPATLVSSETGERYLRLKFQTDKAVPAGSFVLLKLKGSNPHPYTVALADDTSLTLFIRKTSRFAHTLQQLAVNTEVTLEGPYGEAAFNLPEGGRTLFVFQGAGMAQLPAVLQTLQDSKQAPQAHILILARNAQDELYAQCQQQLAELQTQGLELELHFSEKAGHFADANCKELFRAKYNRVYFCGGQEVKAMLYKAYQHGGGHKRNFVCEYTAWRSFAACN